MIEWLRNLFATIFGHGRVMTPTVSSPAPKAASKPFWPLQKDCDTFYGNPRGSNGAASPLWEHENLVSVTPPFIVTYDGKPVRSIRIHKKCAESFVRVLHAIWEAAARDQKTLDKWGASIYAGSYNYRLMRGISTLSMHAYGCAVDFDPARNGLGNKNPNFTPDHPVVRAFLDEGWVWGGDWNGNGSTADERRCDGMHFRRPA